MPERYDVIVVGTGFAGSFFLQQLLEKSPPTIRVLVLERGRFDSHQWQFANRRNSSLSASSLFHNVTPDKPWVFTPGFGGGSNCWWAVTPRMLPADFELHTRHGVGRDWPVTYDDLQPHYNHAEQVMSVSGSDDGTPFPGLDAYPQPPHRFTDPDRVLKRFYPDRFFHQPTARARVPTDGRPACCASGVCRLCPVDAKFTIENGMMGLYRDPRVRLLHEATVTTVETRGNTATGVRYRTRQGETVAEGDLVVLAANAIFNAHILQESGAEHPLLGRRLNEQVSVNVRASLGGIDNLQGSTSLTGHGYMFYDGPHRATRAACLLETSNMIPRSLRMEPGRWRQLLDLKFIFEDLPSEESFVAPSREIIGQPATTYGGSSAYAQRGIAQIPAMLSELSDALPIESYEVSETNSTEAHILGTTVMGTDPETSVLDRHLLHHRIRNLVVLGSGAFPSCPPANPTLTIAALSSWSADYVVA